MCYEYVLVGSKLLMLLLKDDVPFEVHLQLKRVDFLTRKIISNEPDEEKEASESVDAAVATHRSLAVLDDDPEMRRRSAS